VQQLSLPEPHDVVPAPLALQLGGPLDICSFAPTAAPEPPAPVFELLHPVANAQPANAMRASYMY